MKTAESSLRCFVALVIGFGLFILSSGVIFSQDRVPVYAYETTFMSAVNILNASTATAGDITAIYHDATVAGQATPTVTPTPVTAFTLSLNARGSRSVLLENLFLKADRTIGGGVLTSSKALVAVVVQNPRYSEEVVAQPVSNGPRGTASTIVQLATFSKNTDAMTSIVAVQNVDTMPITVTLQPYEANGTTRSTQTRTHIPPGSSAYFDASLTTGDNFSGSAKLTGTGKIFATVTELATNNYYAYSFEGAGGADALYLPTVSCDAYDVTTYIAIRNIGSSTTTITITYSNGNTLSQSVVANAKWSVSACDAYPTDNASGFSGAATISTNSGFAAANIVAVAKSEKKVEVSGVGEEEATVLITEYRSAYTAVATGARTLALPYIRWANSANWGAGSYHSRTYIAIQNVGSAKIEDPIKVHYIAADGTIAATHTINTDVGVNEKVNSDPSLAGLTAFGYYSGAVYGGSVVIQGPAGSQLTAVARTVKNTNPDGFDDYVSVAEDYTGIPIPDNAVSLP